jgi:hypothetical protein
MLSHIRDVEEILVEGLKIMFERYRKEPPVLRGPRNEPSVFDLYPAKYSKTMDPPTPKHTKCSEQLRAEGVFRTYPTTPLYIIDGWGGSGKTACLYHITQKLPPNSFLVLTAQAANAAGCQNLVHFNAQTIHMILMMHQIVCPKSPYFEPSSFAKCRVRKLPTCETLPERRRFWAKLTPKQKHEFKNPMEVRGIRCQDTDKTCFLLPIQTLIIDEISLVDDELFAIIVYILATCGSLKQLIVCGDHRQKPQIGWGCLFDDLIKGFPDSIIQFQHCHRFESGTLFTNARAIHENRFDDVKFDGQLFQMIDTDPIVMKHGRDVVREKYRTIFTTHNIKAEPDNIIVTRSNDRKMIISDAIRDLTFGDSRNFHLGQKIYLSKTDNRVGFIHKLILIILEINDVEIPARTTKSSMKLEAAVNARGEILRKCRHTGEPIPRGNCIRKIIACPLGCERDMSKRVHIPFFGKHKGLVVDASVVNYHFVQGSEFKNVIVDHTTFFGIADNKRVLFTIATRPTASIKFISKPEVMKKWCENNCPVRLSILHAALQKIAIEHNIFLFEWRYPGRTKNGITIDPQFVAFLNCPRIDVAEDEALKEGDKFDATAMVKRSDDKQLMDILAIFRAMERQEREMKKRKVAK